MSKFTVEQLLDLIEQNGGPQALDLHRRDLSEIDLRPSVIREMRRERGWPKEGQEPPWYWPATGGINLSGANLLRTNWARASLLGANLSGANLWEASLSEASLEKASLSQTHLSKANLSEATLFEANLSEATLWRANLSAANLVGANLARADLSGADLSKADLSRADLSQARLKEANLREVDLWAVSSLQGAYLEDAWLERTFIPKEKLGSLGEEGEGLWGKAQRTYHGLRLNWIAQGEYGLARWAQRKERHMERQGYQKRWGQALKEKKGLDAVSLGWKIAWNQVDYHFWDYSGSPWRVMLWLMALIGAWAFFYWLFGSLAETAQWYDYPLFSLRTSATLAFAATGQTGGDGTVKLLMALQGVLSLFGYAALVYTLGRRSSGF